MQKSFFHLILLLSCAALAACRVDTAYPQMQYSAMRDSCQELAELKVDWMAQRSAELGDTKQRNAKLVDVFTDCMANNNWDVGRPKETEKPKEKVAAKEPSQLTNRGVGVGVGPTYALHPEAIKTKSAVAPSNVPEPVPPPPPRELPGFEPQIAPVTTEEVRAAAIAPPPPVVSTVPSAPSVPKPLSSSKITPEDEARIRKTLENDSEQ